MKIIVSYDKIKKEYEIYRSICNSNITYEMFLDIYKLSCISLLLADVYNRFKK